MPQQPDYGYGARWDEATQSYSGPPKGLGWLGPLIRPDSDPKNPTIQSEYSIDGEIDGKPRQFPSLVPTLTKDEVRAVLTSKDGERLPASVYQKAQAWAAQRIAAGKDPFAGPGEQQQLYPEFQRATVPARKDSQMPQSGENKTFPNGAVGQWDGEGWVMVSPPKAAAPQADASGSFKDDLNDAGLGALKGLAQTTSGAVGLIPGVSRATNALGNAIGGMAGNALYGTKAEPVSQESAAKSLEPANTAEQVGKTAEQIGEFFVPAGAARKAATGLVPVAKAGSSMALNKIGVLLARTLAEGGSAGAVSGLQGGDVGTAAALGAAGPLAAGAAGPASKAIKTALPLAAIYAADKAFGAPGGLLGVGAALKGATTLTPAMVKALERAIRSGAPLAGRAAAGMLSPQQSILDQLGGE